jgi:hypothetical protein|tara:strand:+ start:138 stop:1409 length:1272 start_codon:yes stop_codon:yes gene_type:complete
MLSIKKWFYGALCIFALEETMKYFAPDFLLYIYILIVLLITWEGLFSLSKHKKINSCLVWFKEKVGILASYSIIAFFVVVFALSYWWGIQRIFSNQEVLEVPRFSEEETNEVSISVGDGQSFTTSLSSLKGRPHIPFNFNGYIPIKLYYSENNIYADVKVYGGSGFPPIQIKKNKLINKPPNWDFNSNEKALEVVNEDQVPMYQYIYKTPSHIIINGIFPYPEGLMFTIEGGIIMNPSPSKIFSLKPIFKYPSWKYPGEYKIEEKKEMAESKKHKTLYNYFENDFGLLAVRSSVKLSKPNSNETTTIEYKLNMDTVSNSKFISYYVPPFPSSIKTYENILALINAHIVAFDHVGKKYTIDSHSPGDSSYDYSKNLKFSGKIYIYHAGELTLEQKGEISRQYKGKGLVLQLRDQDYATMQNLSK